MLTAISTTVEIILYYLTQIKRAGGIIIYNSRNYSILLNMAQEARKMLYLQQ